MSVEFVVFIGGELGHLHLNAQVQYEYIFLFSFRVKKIPCKYNLIIKREAVDPTVITWEDGHKKEVWCKMPYFLEGIN